MKEHNKDNQLYQKQLEEAKKDGKLDVVKKSFTMVEGPRDHNGMKKDLILDMFNNPSGILQIVIVAFLVFVLVYLFFPQLFF